MSRRRYVWAWDGCVPCPHCNGFQRLFVAGDNDEGPFKCFNCQKTFPRTGRLVEVTPDYVGQRRSEGRKSEEEVYGHITATDGTDLSTKRRHREYMATHNLTVADDFRQTWEKAAGEMKSAQTPGSGWGSRERREDLGRAMHALRSRRRA